MKRLWLRYIVYNDWAKVSNNHFIMFLNTVMLLLLLLNESFFNLKKSFAPCVSVSFNIWPNRFERCVHINLFSWWIIRRLKAICFVSAQSRVMTGNRIPDESWKWENFHLIPILIGIMTLFSSLFQVRQWKKRCNKSVQQKKTQYTFCHSHQQLFSLKISDKWQQTHWTL